ncbi:MAG: hypothetical protein ACRD5L_11010, partial [Bryobacteraceae bacterium]
ASDSKLPSYILPAVPPIILLLADTAAKLIRRRDDLARWTTAGLGATWLVLVVLAGLWLGKLPADSPFARPEAWRLWLLMAGLGGMGIAALGWGRRIAAAVLLNAILCAGLLEAGSWAVLPKLDRYLSPRTATQELLAAAVPREQVRAYQLQRGWRYGFEYYLHEPLVEWTPAISREAARPVWVLTTEAAYGSLAASGFPTEVLQKSSSDAWLVRVDPAK